MEPSHLPCSSLTHPAAILTPSIGVLRCIRAYQRGTVVVAADGTPIGLASHARRFYGQSVVWGGLSLRYLPAVLLDSAIHLLERPPSHLGITPAAVAYYGPDLTRPVDGPVTRELLAEYVQEALSPNPPKDVLGDSP